MSHLEGKPLFSRIVLGVAMETMHFHMSQTGFSENFVSHLGDPGEHFGIHEKCPDGAR